MNGQPISTFSQVSADNDTVKSLGTRPRRKPSNGHADRLPPHSPEAELGVLGCILLSPVECLASCQEAGVQKEWFYDLRHHLIYHAMLKLGEAQVAIDPITLCERLKHTDDLEGAGGIAYVSKLPDTIPSAANLAYYLEILREKFLLRSIVKSFTEGVGDIYDEGKSFDAIISATQEKLMVLGEERATRNERSMVDLVPGVMRELEDYHRGHAQMSGLTTGLDYLDKLTCGLGGTKKGNFLVLSARPSTGKTTLATQIAVHVALDHIWFTPMVDDAGTEIECAGKLQFDRHQGMPVGIFSLEMRADALVEKMIFQRAQVDIQTWRTGFAGKEDQAKLTAAGREIAAAKIFICDDDCFTIERVVAKAERMAREHGVKLFILDYIQLLHLGANRYREDRVRELTYISARLARLANKQLNLPFLIIAQMNRDYEKEPNRAPRLSDLKDCGAIEQDADFVGFLYERKMSKENRDKFEEACDKVYGSSWSKHPRAINLLVEKQRYGPTGECRLLFHKSYTGFEDYNLWLKKHGLKEVAHGEKAPARDLDL